MTTTAPARLTELLQQADIELAWLIRHVAERGSVTYERAHAAYRSHLAGWIAECPDLEYRAFDINADGKLCGFVQGQAG